MKRPVGPGTLVLGLVLAATAGAQELPPAETYRIRAEYREFRPSLTGEVQKGLNGVSGTVLDLQDDLDMDDQRTFAIRAILKLGAGHKIRGSYTPFNYRGDVTANRAYRYGDSTFERFGRVVTSLKGAYYTADYEWDFLRGPRGFLGVVVGAKVVDADTLIVAPNSGVREQQTVRAPIPVLGAAARVYASRVSLEGEFSGLTIGSRGYLYEMDLSARIHISDRIAAQGGYRLVSSHGEQDDDQFRLRLSGWQFGLELSL